VLIRAIHKPSINVYSANTDNERWQHSPVTKIKQSNYPSEVHTHLNINRSKLYAATLHATQQKKFYSYRIKFLFNINKNINKK
jgi:hypothetical protein